VIGRRGLLRSAGLGAATLLVMGDGLIAYRAYDQGVLSEGRGPAFRAVKDWKTYKGPVSAVAAAVLAASAHNTQPWVFAVSATRIDVFADPQRTTGANDALDREFHVSLGCALENLLLGAHANGYATDVALDPGGEADLVATVTLRPAPPLTTELYDAIGSRRSNRSEYNSDPLPTGTIESMAGLVDESVSPARLMFLDQEPGRGEFGELLVEATRAHVADEQQSLASFAWWRSSWDEVQRHKDGLNIDGVGLSPVVRTLGKLLPATSRTSADSTFVDLTVNQARSAAAFGVITVDDSAVLGQQLAGGRLLQRLHLWATAHGLGFQHMNQITERIDRDRQQAATGVFDARLADLVGGTALTAFRIGYPTLPSRPSPRRPAEEVLR
jgi:nitroreductase